MTGKPTIVSTFTNDAGYLTSVPAQTLGQCNWQADRRISMDERLRIPDQRVEPGMGQSDRGAGIFLTSVPAQDWSTITSKPTIPTTTSQLTNNSGFLTSISGSGASLTANTVPWRRWSLAP